MFEQSFKAGDNDPMRDSFNKHYMLLVENNHFNIFINNKPFFEQPIKNEEEAYEKIVEMSRKNDYSIGNFHQIYYKLLATDLTRQTNRSIPQKIHFAGKLEKNNGATMFFYL